MLTLAAIDVDPATKLDDGSRLWTPGGAMIVAQGGDPDAPLATAADEHTVVADRDGC